MSMRIRPVDRLVAAYNLLLAGVWIVLAGRAPHAPWIAAAHAATATLPCLFAAMPTRPSRAVRALREGYPLIFLAAFWPELDLLRPALALASADGAVATLDRRIFGVHIHALWMPRMPQLWISEAMHLMYYAYYPLIFLPPLVLALQGRRAAFRDMSFRLMVTYLACYLVYIVLPVDGPHFLMERHAGPHTEGFFYRLVQETQALGDSRGASFPSSHVAGATTIAYLAWRWLRPSVATLLTLEAAGVLLSTIYTQNHYAVDSLAGLVVGLTLQLAAVPALRRGLAPSRVRPLPVLPEVGPVFPAVPATGGGV